MNILYLTGSLNIGGTEIYTLNMATAMKERGHTVFWGTTISGTFQSIASDHSIALIDCPLHKRLPIAMLRSISVLRRTVSQNNIDIIHSADAYSALVATLAFRKCKKRPKLIWSNVGISSTSYPFMKSICGNKLDLILAASHYIRNRMIEIGFNPSSVSVHMGGRSLCKSHKTKEQARQEYGFDSSDIVIGSVGRLVHLKGNHTLIESLPMILRQYPSAKLVLVGDGEARAELESLASDLGVSDHVIFTGAITHIEDVYTAFDIVAFPTLFEALGYIPFEAMYYEKPLVASYVGGVPEIVRHMENGLLIPPACADLWAKAIICLLGDVELQKHLVDNGKRIYVSELAPEISGDRLEKIYTEVNAK